MGWITPHSLFSLRWDEWGSISAILVVIVGIIRWVIKKLDIELFEPIRRQLSDVNDNLTEFNRRQSKIEARLENDDKKFIRHNETLKDHERRIGVLEARDHQ